MRETLSNTKTLYLAYLSFSSKLVTLRINLIVSTFKEWYNMDKYKRKNIRRRWNIMGVLLALKEESNKPNKNLSNYSLKEIKEICELETNYSTPESFDNLWNKKKKE